MHARVIMTFLLFIAVVPGAEGCRHFGSSDESDASPGPHCDPCAQYQMAVNECVIAACTEKGCVGCEANLHLTEPACATGADAGSGGFDGTIEISPGLDAGTCSGEERDDAYTKLLQFNCEDDPLVAVYVRQLDNVCVTCLAAGDACSQGYCYYSSTNGQLKCMSPGGAVEGDTCYSTNDCRGGAQCLDTGGPSNCYTVCRSPSSCGTSESCVDTGYGFEVCYADY